MLGWVIGSFFSPQPLPRGSRLHGLKTFAAAKQGDSGTIAAAQHARGLKKSLNTKPSRVLVVQQRRQNFVRTPDRRSGSRGCATAGRIAAAEFAGPDLSSDVVYRVGVLQSAMEARYS